MSYEVGDTEIKVAIEINSIIEHLSQLSVESLLEVRKSTTALLKKLQVPFKRATKASSRSGGAGSGPRRRSPWRARYANSAIIVHVANALTLLVEQFQSECNKTKDPWDYTIEHAVKDLLEACLEGHEFSVISKRYADFFKDYVEQTVGPKPFGKLKEWGTITGAMGKRGGRTEYPMFVVLKGGIKATDCPQDLLSAEGVEEEWEFLAGKSVESLLLLTVQTGG